MPWSRSIRHHHCLLVWTATLKAGWEVSNQSGGFGSRISTVPACIKDKLYVAGRVNTSWLSIEMEELEACVLFPSPKQQETQRLRERNRIAKRASRARQRQREQHNDTTADVAVQSTPTAEATSQDLAVPLHPPQHPGSGSGSGSGSDSACVRAEASEDLGVWALDGPLDDPSALPWPSSLDEDWPGFSGSLVDTLSPRQLSVSVSVPGISNPEPRAPPASSSSLTSDSNDSNSRPSRLLHIAARNGTTGILLSLINAGADVNSRDSSGTTPLHIAVRFRRASALELLVNHGANINARDSANMTALEVAVRAQDEELVNILLSGGAELH